MDKRRDFSCASFCLVSQTSGLTEWTFFSSHPLIFFFLSTRVSREIQSVSQHIQSCLANPTGISANMKILQKSLGRPLPFKVSVLCLQKNPCIYSNIQIRFEMTMKIYSTCFPGQQKCIPFGLVRLIKKTVSVYVNVLSFFFFFFVCGIYQLSR